MGVRQMLFSEIYGSYFNVVAAVLSEAAENTLTTGKLTAIVQEKAFAESVLSIPAALQSGAWPLLDSGYHTVLRGKPTMPLTTLQKRWLKALLSDPRIALFDPDMRGLEDVEPLYTQIPSSGLTSTQTEIPIPIPIMFIAFAWYCERSMRIGRCEFDSMDILESAILLSAIRTAWSIRRRTINSGS